MAEFKLGRIKFVWQGPWVTGTAYVKDDVVSYNGKTYICALGHTAAASFNTDLNIVPAKWELMSDGQTWRSDWTTSYSYEEGDLVKYGGNTYLCNLAHTSAATTNLGLENDQAKWDVFVEGFDWKGDWTVSTRYKVNDIVSYGGTNYVCNAHHTSAATATLGLENNQASWDYFSKGVEYKSTWVTGTRYKVNDVVKYGAGLWVCTVYHTAGATFAGDNANWSQFVEGIEFESTWSSATAYQPGDVVLYGGNQYVAKTQHTNSNPVTGTANWDLFTEGLKYQSSWSISTSYKIGEVVSLGGYAYLATGDSPSNALTVTATNAGTKYFTTSDTGSMVANMAVQFSGTTFGNVFTGGTYYIKQIINSTQFTISTSIGGTAFTPTTSSGSMTATFAAQPPNASYWTLITSGLRWRSTWSDDTYYVAGDLVKYSSNVYICVLAHRSEGDDGSTIGATGGGEINSRPDLDLTSTYWNIFNAGKISDVMTTTGDLIYRAAGGATRLPIGTEGQILRVSSAGIPEWVTWGTTEHVYYVAPHGEDRPYPDCGASLDKPWKTVRYACEQIEQGPRNVDAAYLLELNRAFIQREVTEWIDYQVTNNISPFTTSFVYAQDRCQRDVGFVLDRIIYDIRHGGNLKTRAAAQTYVNALAEGPFSSLDDSNGTGTYTLLSAQADEDIASYNYMLEVMTAVLANEAPAANYQVTNGDNSTAIVDQYINTNYTAESTALSEITSLLSIITDALEAQDSSTIPDRYVPGKTLFIKTGRYRETLPIIVEEGTALVGDETRSVNVGPADSLIDPSDVYYTTTLFDRISTVVGSIVTGAAVTPTVGNLTSQDINFPYASSTESTKVQALVQVMKHLSDYNTEKMAVASYPDPTGFGTSIGVGSLVVGSEYVITSIGTTDFNTPAGTSAITYAVGDRFVATTTGTGTGTVTVEYKTARTLIYENKEFLKAEVLAYLETNYPNLKYGKTDTKRDAGYIVDAIIYDLTYGGNSQSIIAGLAYFDAEGTTNLIPTSIKAATLASISHLSTIMQQVTQNTVVTALQVDIPQWRDTSLTGGSIANTRIAANIQIIYDLIDGANTTSAPSVTITTIASTTTLTTSAAHGLKNGDTIVPRSTANGLTTDVVYYVVSTPSTTTMTVSTTFGGSATTFTNGTSLTIICDKVDYPNTNWGTLTTQFGTLSAQIATIGTSAVTYINTNYPALVGTYNTTKSERDVRKLLQAVGRDMIFNSNYATLKAAHSFLRANSAELYENIDLKRACRASLTYVKDQAKSNVGGNATAQSRIETLMTLVDAVIFGAANEGDTCQSENANIDWAVLQLERNREFIVDEVSAYITNTFKDIVTASDTTLDTLSIGSTSWLKRNTAIVFSAPVFGGITAGTTYYVQNVVSSTQFTVATTRNATTPLNISTAAGLMPVRFDYDVEYCLRDVGLYIDALKWDLKYNSNYKSRYVARYYANAVRGNKEEDMFYLRNATGVRNMTLADLDGQLTPENEFGTSRTTAGAYCSLDPGWGAADFRTWIFDRSPYVQNVATTGNAAIGQKIDGALHDGGNRSIVSNDFTQLISDGIGAWVTNNARAELVSVFTYYSHIGYLAENGGRIRGTNGNNSYGDFGSVAEGFDTTETPITGIVDNRQFDAAVDSVFTDGDTSIFHFEFSNAGSRYSRATWSVAGSGSGAIVSQDEFRDGAVFQVRLLDNVDDSANAPEASGNFGGYLYVSNSNLAQGGTTTNITIAAPDSEISAAYVGMKIYLTAGTGAGQFGRIATYNAGTKLATIYKETTTVVTAGSFSVSSVYIIETLGTTNWNTAAGTTGVTYAIGDLFVCANAGSGTGTAVLMAAGWDHVVPGTTIDSPDASTSYTIEPNLYFSHPGYSSSDTTIATSMTQAAIAYAPVDGVYAAVSASGGTGSGATFNVVRRGNKYYDVQKVTSGTNYTRLDTLTILGTSLGGASSTNDITITVLAVNSTTGAITAFETTGDAAGGNFVMIPNSARTNDTSPNGSSWTARTNALPSSSNWTSAVSGELNAVETAGSFVSGRAYVITSLGNTTWTLLGAFQAIVGTYFIYNGYSGAGYTGTSGTATPVARHLVVVSSSTTVNAYSTDGGVTFSSGGALPGGMSGTCVSVTFGSYTSVNRWVAIGSGGTSAYSTNGGVSWTAGGSLGAGTWQEVTYGKGRFVAVASNGTTAYSTDGGATWTTSSSLASISASGWQSMAYGANRWVAIRVGFTSTTAAYSLDGVTWTASTLPNSVAWQQIRYGQGVFLAVAVDLPTATTSRIATSENGIDWTSRVVSTTSPAWYSTAFGNPNGSGVWVFGRGGGGGTQSAIAYVGARTRGRAYVADDKIYSIRLIEPGSGYLSAPTLGICDPSNLYEAPTQVRIGYGVLCQPSFNNRGTAYATAQVNIDTGDGYADNFQSGNYVAIKRLTTVPQAGANVVFATQPNTVYKLVQVLSLTGSIDGAQTAFFQLSPELPVYYSPADATAVTTRIRYSQVRLTGHDFLDIGTGSFGETNYPDGEPDNQPNPDVETNDLNGGRCFYTSTDQDGNFRVGELFTIEQSTGVATLNADAFNIAGLAELTLGSVTLGGSSATVTEFSTDPFFTADSDSVVPTQRAIKSYIAAQIGGGGASLNVNSVVAGFIYIAGTQITTTTGGTISMKANFNFQGGVLGLPLAFNYFLT